MFHLFHCMGTPLAEDQRYGASWHANACPNGLGLVPLSWRVQSPLPYTGRTFYRRAFLFSLSLSWLKPDGIEDVLTTVVVVEHPLDLFLLPWFIACTDAGDFAFAVVHEVDDDLGFHAYLSWFVSSYIYNVTPFLSLLKFLRKINKQNFLPAFLKITRR